MDELRANDIMAKYFRYWDKQNPEIEDLLCNSFNLLTLLLHPGRDEEEEELRAERFSLIASLFLNIETGLAYLKARVSPDVWNAARPVLMLKLEKVQNLKKLTTSDLIEISNKMKTINC